MQILWQKKLEADRTCGISGYWIAIVNTLLKDRHSHGDIALIMLNHNLTEIVTRESHWIPMGRLARKIIDQWVLIMED